jgi:hypothetical protein
MSDVDESDSGLASGIVNTAFMMGGALGLAVLASVAATRTGALPAGAPGAEIVALNAGYRLAFAVGALCALGAAALAVLRMPVQVVSPAARVASATTNSAGTR